MNNVEAMAEMLRYRRPHKSKTERRFLQRFISTLKDMKHDKYGNRYTRIGTAPIMYSCHSDSVHHRAGLQDIAISGNVFKLASREKISNCLGADNGAGVWLMREMILKHKPGLYVFHRGEERGGLGSKFLTKNTPQLVDGIKAAVAFDRRGTKSIITHQFGGRCCSDDFGESLAKELKLGHKLDKGGTFTDTANYTNLVPECTNVSVGFQHEHSSHETLDMAYLIELRQAMLEMDWEKLVIKRKAGEYEPRYTYDYTAHYNKSKGSHYHPRYRHNEDGSWDKWDSDAKEWIADPVTAPFVGTSTTSKRKGKWDWDEGKLVHRKPAGFLPDLRQKSTKDENQGELLPDGHELDESDRPLVPRYASSGDMDHMFMHKMVTDNPSLVVKLLKDYGVDADDLADFLYSNAGHIPPGMLSRIS